LDFIPWGVDGTLQVNSTFGPVGATNGPVGIAAAGLLTNRLFALPATKQMILDRERSLLTSVWNEAAMQAEINRIETLLQPIIDPVQGLGWHNNLNGMRNFVSTRRATLLAALDAGPTWPDPPKTYPCLDIIAEVTGTFSTTYGTIGNNNPLGTGTGTFSITMGGQTTVLTPVHASAGPDPDNQGGAPRSAIQVFGQRASDNHIVILVITVPTNRFSARSMDLGFFDGNGYVVDYNPATNTSAIVGFMLGTATLTQASSNANAAVVGSFTSHVDMQGMP